MTPEIMETVVFSIGGIDFDGLAILLSSLIILSLIVGSMTMWVALRTKGMHKYQRVYIGSLSSIMLSCGVVLGMAFC